MDFSNDPSENGQFKEHRKENLLDDMFSGLRDGMLLLDTRRRSMGKSFSFADCR